MKNIWLIAIAMAVIGCEKPIKPSEKQENINQWMESSNAMIEKYKKGPAAAAIQALKDHREATLQSQGWHGEVKPERENLMIDARLFVVYEFLNQKAEAEHWYQSYLTNLYKLQMDKGKQPSAVSREEVRDIVARLDQKLDVKWMKSPELP